jgi:hypothetical protein
MAQLLIIMDVGTTNSSVYMVRGERLLARFAQAVGARGSAMSGSNAGLHRALIY